MEAGGGGDDVDDGVDGAYFVEVDVLDGDVVNFGFGGAEELESANREGFDFVRKCCFLNEIANDGKGAAVFVGVRFVGVRMAGFVLMLGLWMVLMGGGMLVRLLILVRF